MQRWFRALPQAARNITNNSDYDVDESLLRKMAALKRELQSVEYNPLAIFSQKTSVVTLRDFSSPFFIALV